MNLGSTLLIGACLLTAGLVLLSHSDPASTKSRAGRVFAFVALALAPLTLTALGTRDHLDRATSTEFCLSCHLMEDYGESMHADTQNILAAVHYQNRWVPRKKACYTCHTTYTMFGGVNAKMVGAKHLLVNVMGTAEQPLELYQPYDNRECLFCHGGARRYEEVEDHVDTAAEVASGELSCLECHGPAHAVEDLDEYDSWKDADS